MNTSMLLVSRLPARLTEDQAGEILGFLPQEISALMSSGWLRPLGRPAANGHKFFCAWEISELAASPGWLGSRLGGLLKFVAALTGKNGWDTMKKVEIHTHAFAHIRSGPDDAQPSKAGALIRAVSFIREHRR